LFSLSGKRKGIEGKAGAREKMIACTFLVAEKTKKEKKRKTLRSEGFAVARHD
jgi:hypothetical protein